MNGRGCAIFGTDPSFKNEVPALLKTVLRRELAKLYANGFKRFYIGDETDAGLLAGELVLEMRESKRFSDLELVIAIPFEGHDAEQAEERRERLERLKRRAAVVTVSIDPSSASIKARDRLLVDSADCLLLIWGADLSLPGGARYAAARGVPITVLHPYSGAVAYIG